MVDARFAGLVILCEGESTRGSDPEHCSQAVSRTCARLMGLPSTVNTRCWCGPSAYTGHRFLQVVTCTPAFLVPGRVPCCMGDIFQGVKPVAKQTKSWNRNIIFSLNRTAPIRNICRHLETSPEAKRKKYIGNHFEKWFITFFLFFYVHY